MKFSDLQDLPSISVSHNPDIKKQVMLEPGDVPNLVYFSQARFKPGQVASGHTHVDMSEVFLVEQGDGSMTINGSVYKLSPGVCVAVHPGDVHEVKNMGNHDLILTYFGIRSSTVSE